MSDNTQLQAPTSSGDVISTDDLGGFKVQRVKVQIGTDGNAADVNSGNPMPVTMASSPLPSGAATDATVAAFESQNHTDLGAIFSRLSNDPATQTTLAAVLAKLSSDPATQTTLAAILAKLSADPSTNTTLTAFQNANHADLVALIAKIPALGQALMAASLPVVIASDQSALPVSAAALPLPAGAATAANQATEIASLASIDAGIPAGLGQTTMANSMPVALASDQTLPLPSGAATSANQATEITALNLLHTDNLAPTPAGNNLIGHVIVDAGPGSSNVALENGGNLENISNDLDAIQATTDLLGLAFDKNENTPLFVSQIDSKRDSTGGLIPSDAPAPIYGGANAVSANLFIIDTTGYQSVAVQVFGTFSATYQFTTSNDGVNWQTLQVLASNSSIGYNTAFAVTGVFIAPSVGKFLRVQVTAYTSGLVQALAYLRQAPLPANGNFYPFNLAQVNGVTTVISGVGGVLAVGGNASPGAARTAQPNTVSGTDSGNLVRVLRTDTTGNVGMSVTDQQSINRPLGGLPNTIQNITAAAVMDVNQVEGQSRDELLSQILTEMRIMNQYLFELPTMLQKGFATLNNSNNTLDYSFRNEPQEFRNDQSIFVN